MKNIVSFIEILESRIAPATFIVTSTADSGGGSLRQFIDQANLTDAPDTITFAPSAFGTILLGGTELPIITHPLIIKGPGANKVIIDANNQSRIFHIDDGGAGNGTDSPVTISGLAMINGNATGSAGGAILDYE